MVVVLFLLPAPNDGASGDRDMQSADRASAIAPQELSERILAGAGDVVVLDVRAGAAWQKQHVRGAVSLPAAELDRPTIAALPENRRIVVYGDDEAESLAAWAEIIPARPLAMVLRGGFEGWRRDVLEPNVPAADAPEEAWEVYRERRAVADYYLGRADDTTPERPVRTLQPVLRPRPSSGVGEGC